MESPLINFLNWINGLENQGQAIKIASLLTVFTPSVPIATDQDPLVVLNETLIKERSYFKIFGFSLSLYAFLNDYFREIVEAYNQMNLYGGKEFDEDLIQLVKSWKDLDNFNPQYFNEWLGYMFCNEVDNNYSY